MQNDIQQSSNDTQQSFSTKKNSRKEETTSRYIKLGLGIVVVFVLGYFVGSGRLVMAGKNGYGAAPGTAKTIDYSQVNEVYKALRDNYNGTISEQQVLDGLKHGLAQSVHDPYTEFFTATEAQQFNGELQGTITGIGAKLELNQDGNVAVVAPLAGSPAEAAGLRAKDVIVTVDGKSTSGMTATEAVLKIRGDKGTQVKLGVVRDGNQSLVFTITRDTVKVPTATSKILDGNVGYLQVSQFSDDTDQLVDKAVEGFKQQGVKKIILDLRDNPGGEVKTAVNLSSLWLQQGDMIVEQRHGNTVIDSSRATNLNSLHGLPTVVLVNAGSASASEITTLALRDHKAAYVIGEKTYGKGVVQQLMPFSDGSALKVTIAKWYSPNGTNIDKKGIVPDQTVSMSDDDYKNGNDPQLQAAQAYLQNL